MWTKKPLLHLSAELWDAAGKPIDGAVPLHIVISDAHGQHSVDLYRTAVGGKWVEVLPIAAGPADGHWAICVQELFSGKTATGTLSHLLPPKPPDGTATPAVEWMRASEAAAALKNAGTVALLVSTKQTGVAPAAAAVKQALELLTTPWCR